MYFLSAPGSCDLDSIPSKCSIQCLNCRYLSSVIGIYNNSLLAAVFFMLPICFCLIFIIKKEMLLSQ